MLPGIGFTELMVLAVAALIIVGPKDLPMMMRRLGQFVGKGRAMAREFQAAFDDIARQSELDDLRKEIEDLKLSNSLKKATGELSDYEKDVNSAVMAESRSEAADKLAQQTSPETPEAKSELESGTGTKLESGPKSGPDSEPDTGPAAEPKGDTA
ncbi:Sec-independent protein translocase protein TatB [Hyphomonas adhaerens]|uniref:Sec-independent protein translocase protein TatB n=1 Tax=Hyphomonas adhaerens TaxID=81029 RepID=A0A3B9GUC7_9PROT|nr:MULTISPECIES: Sec-independent protein translocase protein TatB [Hyphomonas]MBB41996.1 twin-arginine translocase subunit TatB [Hyphomonas sp.]HAE25614.1 twin-arginine translocase subunit TatB [Hyphomonas adhaerens]|tara:strand:- start:244 stop:708 length:465 start_codon:yes stop_codon:yes gene_type:complete